MLVNHLKKSLVMVDAGVAIDFCSDLTSMGSYILAPHPDGEPLFDWSPRNPRLPIPPDEAKVEKATRSLVADILRTPLTPAKQDTYIVQAINHFRIGCVQEVARPKDSLREIEALKKVFVIEALGSRIATRLRIHFWMSTASLFASLLVGLLLKYQVPNGLPVDYAVISNFSFVWLAAMAAIIVNDSVLAKFNDIDDYWRQERTLSTPVVRVIATGIIAEVVALGLDSGAFTIKIGRFDSGQIETSVAVALFTGFIVGVAASDLIKVIIGKAKRALSAT